MNEDRLNELLERCESPIERELLQNLYPHLTRDGAQELRAQHMIDYYRDMDLTIPDFAFSEAKIAVYCDGFAKAKYNKKLFVKDRLQLRELQLRGWIVLRFAGSEIKFQNERVVETIERAIARRGKQRAWWRSKPQQERQRLQKPQLQQNTEGGGRNQQRQPSPVQQEGKSSQESIGEMRNNTPFQLHSGRKSQVHQRQQKPQSQQKPEGGMCGVIVLACVIAGVFVLLNFIF